MSYYMEVISGGRYFKGSDMHEWKERIGDVSRLADISEQFMSGRRNLKIDEAPKSLNFRNRFRSLPDYFKTLGGAQIISTKLKDLIEQFEPEVHKFFPIEARWANGDAAMDGAHLIIVTQRRDTIVPNRSDIKPAGFDQDPKTAEHFSLSGFTKFVTARPDAVQGVHFWRETR